MKPRLSKQQEAVLTRALNDGGTCHSTTAYSALIELGSTLTESDEESILDSTGSVLQSLVELGSMVKSGPGIYDLTEKGSRIADNLLRSWQSADVPLRSYATPKGPGRTVAPGSDLTIISSYPPM